MEEKYMLRAIELAKKGIGGVNPNPLVGAVIVKDGEILAEGYHAKYGDLHAERNAFAHLKDKEAAKGAEMYVTLEPCSHYGKQPPCALAIIEHGIKKVYVGSPDPNPLVAGKGIQMLREAGIEVVEECMREECDELNPVFLHYITTKTPYVVMKYAMTMDGKIATETGHSKWITGENARSHVQEIRNYLPAIMVGVQTVINDDPRLTCRLEGGRNPIRIIVDSHLRTPLDAGVVTTANEVKTIIATVEETDEMMKETDESVNDKHDEIAAKIKSYKEAGCIMLTCKSKDDRVDLNDLMIKLGEMKIDGILLEGGGTLNQSALKAGIVNRAMVYIAPKIFGGKGSYSPVVGEGVLTADQGYQFEPVSIEMFDEDILITYDRI